MSYNTELQSNNAELQEILDAINALPEEGESGGSSGGGSETLKNICRGYGINITKEDIDGVETIESSAFLGFPAFNIDLPSSVKAISDFAFAYSELMNITLPEGLLTIGDFTFEECNFLFDGISIPSTVTSIGQKALYFGDGGIFITMKPTTPPVIGSNVFKESALFRIVVPIGSGNAYKTATNWSAFADYIYEGTIL